MFILDPPFVSEYLKETVAKNDIPVLKTPYTQSLGLNNSVKFITVEEAIQSLSEKENPPVYSNSENAIEWISRRLPDTKLNDQLNLFKDKIRFRELLEALHPNFYFKGIPFDELDTIDTRSIQKPFIIKPAVGFFSLGVYKVFHDSEWENIKKQIQLEVQTIKRVYPTKVLDTSMFIIEQNIEGDEYAFDAYFNDKGEAVILSLLKHLYAHDGDVSDRVYISSKKIFENNQQSFEEYLQKIGDLAGLKNFPLHVEVRVDDMGMIKPIEVNPMRFGGWCTTADMTSMAFGSNPYLAFHNQLKPDWEKILRDKDGLIYSNIVLTNASGYDVHNIKSFDYSKLKSRFRKVLELRQANYRDYLMFGFIFAETLEKNAAELDWILKDDLREFITI